MSKLENPILSERAPLFLLAILLVLGIALSDCPFFSRPTATTSYWMTTRAWVGYAFLLSLVPVFFLFRHPRIQLLSMLLSVLLFGLFIGAAAHHRAQLPVLSSSADATYRAVVISEPRKSTHHVSIRLLLVPLGRTLTAYLQEEERSVTLKPGEAITFRPTTIHQNQQYPSCFLTARSWQPATVDLHELSLTDRLQVDFLRWRHQLLRRYQYDNHTKDAYAVLAAMTLGEKSALDKELRQTYSVTGASHVLALSGLHLSIIYMLLITLLLQRGSKQSHIVVQTLLVLSIWAFVALVGMPVSVVRSALMITLFALLSLGHRPRLSVNQLAMAAVTILIFSPMTLYDVGFQLSFLTVLSILLFTPLFVGSHQRAVVSACWVSLTAQIGAAPLVAYHFGRFSTYFLLTNLVVLPLAYVVLLGGLAALCLPILTPVVTFCVTLMNSLLDLIGRLPMASIEGLHPSMPSLVIYYGVVGCIYLTIKYFKPIPHLDETDIDPPFFNQSPADYGSSL